MRKAAFKPLGLLLAFVALTAFLIHPNHLLMEENSHSASHCSVCHTIPMGASLPEVHQNFIAFVSCGILLPGQEHPAVLFLSPDSPRGPPAA
jgi:hypothetical protein